MEVKSEETKFGFNFGSMEITRTCSDYKGAAIIIVSTPKGRLSIRASKTGVISVYDGSGVKLNLKTTSTSVI